MSDLGGSPFWVSNQVTNTSTLYAVTGATGVATVPLVVSIPTTGGGPQGPTGQVSNAQRRIVSSSVRAIPIPRFSSSPI